MGGTSPSKTATRAIPSSVEGASPIAPAHGRRGDAAGSFHDCRTITWARARVLSMQGTLNYGEAGDENRS